MKYKVIVLFMVLIFMETSAQDGFRAEVNIGPTVGDATEYFSYSLQGNLYYMWNMSQTIALGLTAGVVVFLGEGKNTNEVVFGSIPDVFFPVAIATKAQFSDLIIGLDIGYGISANAFGSSEGDFIEDGNGGFYFRPLFGFNINEKLALIVSFSSIKESHDTSSALSVGVNIGF